MQIQPIDGQYFETTYFILTTLVGVVLAAIAAFYELK